MHSRMVGVTETWGWRCDGFLAASTATIDDPTEPGFPATDLPHEGKEEYDNMWQKTRSILSYMYDHYFDDYDYFYLSGDDTHLIVENLRRFLYETEQAHDVATTPLFMGMKFKPGKKVVYNGGGAGYVLNRVALQRLVRDTFPTCLVHQRESCEDRFVARCLQKILEIYPLDTVDALGRQRFHGMDSDFVGRFQGKFGFFKKIYEDWGKQYGWKTGIDLVSEQSVTFHIIRGTNQMRRHHAILYQSCPADTVLAKAVREARTERARQSSVVSTSNSSAIAI
jgi:glycoprotein-N-acetylgalactosamine 3-beta-galactosyltransferase